MISDKQTAPLWMEQKKIHCSDVYLFAYLERSVSSFSIPCPALLQFLSEYIFFDHLSDADSWSNLVSGKPLVIIKAV